MNGGRVLGKWPGLAPEKLFEERDLAVTTDFRAVFAEVCTRHFDTRPGQLELVFPGYRAGEKDFPGICKAG